MIELISPCIIVGDIHGQILDLFRILNTFGTPGRIAYLFLGDIVDRGEFSIECLVTVLLLKALHPDSVFVIRGNHEFSSLCSQCGFMSQMMEFFQDSNLYHEAVQVFPYIPLAARIDDSILCVHGGIGPSITSLTSISWLQRPIEEFGDDIVDALVWSDPDPSVDRFETSTVRGAGYLFGEAAVTAFLDEAKLTMLVRAHQCIPEGAKELFGGRVMTVFSASNYCGLVGNQAAVLQITAPGVHEIRRFSPLPWLVRDAAHFTGTVREPRLPRESLSLARKPKGVVTMSSEGRLPVISTPRGRRAKFLESGSLGRLPVFEEMATQILRGGDRPDLPIVPPSHLRAMRPVVRARSKRLPSS
jgi:protein phosphatase